jgi:hypothetical protein
VLVATDTLATSTEGKPYMYTTKAFIVPHLHLIMAGTGVAGFLSRWFVRLNDNFIVRGIDRVNDFAPTTLPVLWQAYKEELSIKDDLMTTVYHFGFSEVTGLIHSFAYRSTNNFRSEQIPYGLRYKPKCTIPENPSPEHITDMMES